MRIEFKGFLVLKLNDGRYHVANAMQGIEFIADSLDDAMQVIGECNA